VAKDHRIDTASPLTSPSRPEGGGGEGMSSAGSDFFIREDPVNFGTDLVGLLE
jgi:hypothetical protein